MSKAELGPEEGLRSLIVRSMEDERLRQRLLEDPKATIERELGAELPAEIEVRAVEETPNTVYLVLPPKAPIHREGYELSEQELDTVAGGFGTPDMVFGGCRFDLTNGCSPPDTLALSCPS